jgi:hypothetical protein
MNVALIKNLSQSGYNPVVFHYSKKDVNFENIECYSIKENRRNLLFILSRIERYLRKYLHLNCNPFIERLFGFSFTLFNDRNSIIKALKLIKVEKYQLILTLSKGGSFRPHHALLKIPEFHDKWMAYIHDPYPMHLYPPPYAWKEPGYKKKENFMKEVFVKSTFLAFPSKLLKDWMGTKLRIKMTKGIVIPHQIYIQKQDIIGFPEYFDIQKFNLLHAGNLLWGRNPLFLIKAFEEFLARNRNARNDARLIFLGNRNHYSQELWDFNAKLDEFYASEDYVAYNKVIAMQNHASVNIILEAKSEISPFLPGKFSHCVRANKPILILGPFKSECRRLLGNNYPYWSEIDDIENIRVRIEFLYDAWKKEKNQYLNRKDIERYLSVRYLKENITQTLNKIKV